MCKFFHVPPFCVTSCSGQIYYVVHKLQSISRVVIHLGLHKHHVVDGKCREYVDETRRSITKEVDRMPYANISVILLSASKTFLVMHLSMIVVMAPWNF